MKVKLWFPQKDMLTLIFQDELRECSMYFHLATIWQVGYTFFWPWFRGAWLFFVPFNMSRWLQFITRTLYPWIIFLESMHLTSCGTLSFFCISETCSFSKWQRKMNWRKNEYQLNNCNIHTWRKPRLQTHPPPRTKTFIACTDQLIRGII